MSPGTRERPGAGAPGASTVDSGQADDEAQDTTTRDSRLTSRAYRRQADKARERAAEARERGNEEQARRFEVMAWARDDAAHLCDRDPDAVIDLDALAAARDHDAPRSIAAIRDRAAVMAAPSPFVSWPTFWAQEHTEHDWVVDRVLARGRGHAIYAAQKAGKSLVALWAAVTAATGPEPVRVLYLDYEMSEADVFERLSDMGYGPESDLSRLRYALLPPLAALDTAEGGAALLELVDQELGHGDHVVVVIDTYGRAVSGEENSNDTTRAFYRYTGIGLKQRGCTWVRLDHAGKDATRGQRGGSAKGDDVDIVWRLDPADDGNYTLHRDVARMGWVPERVAIRKHADPLRFSIGGDAWPPGTRDLADVLTELGVPRDATTRTSRAALKAAGRTASTNLLTAAVRYRKGDGTSRGTPFATDGGTPDGTQQRIGQGQGGTPDGTQRNASGVQSGTFPPLKGGTSADQAGNVLENLGRALAAEVVA